MSRDLIVYDEPQSYVSEIFRTLRTNIQFMNSNKKLNSLLITSTVPDEGKSWISMNLAITFAQAEKKVLLIDADMRKCELHKFFKVPQFPGLSNYLSGIYDGRYEDLELDEYIYQTKIRNLSLLPSRKCSTKSF